MAAPVIRDRLTAYGGAMLNVKGLLIGCAFVVAFATVAPGQSLPRVRAAYTSIGIQFDPVYIMKELDLPRKHGVDAEILFVPVSSRAVQAALAGEIQFITSAGVANINANVSGGDFVGLTATLNTFVFKILASPEIKKPEMLKGKKVGISRLGGASDFSIRYALTRWGLVPDKDVAIIQVGGEQEEFLALQNKAVDAVVLSEPFATLAQRQGSTIVADLSQLEVAYDEMSQRLIRRVPYPDREGIQTIIDQLAKTRPQMKNLNPGDFIDPSILKEIEDSGFVKKLYGN